MIERIFSFADRYPELAAVIITSVVWPIITGLLSLGYARLELRFPALVATLRASGLDVPRTLAALRKAWPKRLPPPPPGPLASLAFVILACLALAVLGVGCVGVPSPRHVVAESAFGVTDVLEEAEPKIREQCILPYAYALRVDDRASLKSIDEECKPKIAAYDGARALVVSARLALSLDDLEALERLGPELVAAGRRLLALIGGAR